MRGKGKESRDHDSKWDAMKGRLKGDRSRWRQRNGRNTIQYEL